MKNGAMFVLATSHGNSLIVNVSVKQSLSSLVLYLYIRSHISWFLIVNFILSIIIIWYLINNIKINMSNTCGIPETEPSLNGHVSAQVAVSSVNKPHNLQFSCQCTGHAFSA